MRTLERSAVFKRDYKRIKATPRHSKDVDSLLSAVLLRLLDDADQDLPESNRDHALRGNWAGYRECHVKPDLLLIYRKTDQNILRLARIGSHSELFS
jgi:mRNA interferase YafQ